MYTGTDPTHRQETLGAKIQDTTGTQSTLGHVPNCPSPCPTPSGMAASCLHTCQHQLSAWKHGLHPAPALQWCFIMYSNRPPLQLACQIVRVCMPSCMGNKALIPSLAAVLQAKHNDRQRPGHEHIAGPASSLPTSTATQLTGLFVYSMAWSQSYVPLLQAMVTTVTVSPVVVHINAFIHPRCSTILMD